MKDAEYMRFSDTPNESHALSDTTTLTERASVKSEGDQRAASK
jgi:hypothetical protein